MEDVQALRPLSPPITQRLKHDLLTETIYHSTHIEGNGLNWRETIAVLNTGVVVSGRYREAQEVLNLKRAGEYIAELMDAPQPLQEVQVRSLHALAMKDLSDDAGSYRDRQVTITGARQSPPDPQDVPPLMQQMVDLYGESSQLDPVVRSAWLHHCVAAVHPFTDGNGRVARLLQEYSLLQADYVPAMVRHEDRRLYYEALESADEGDLNPLVMLCCQRVLDVADKYLAAARDSEQLTSWARGLTQEAVAVTEQREHGKYQQWRRQMENVRLHFELAAAKLNENAVGVTVQIRPYTMIDFARWRSLRDLGTADQTWFFGVDFSHGDLYLRFVFWFARHYWRSVDPPEMRAEQRVTLLVSERDADAPKGHDWIRLDDVLVDRERVSLREVYILGDRVYRRRYDPVEGGDVVDGAMTPQQVTMDFLTEVWRNRLHL
jgi:Fic family protein